MVNEDVRPRLAYIRLGHHASCRPSGRLGHWHRTAQHAQPLQGVLHRHWCYHRLIRRNRIRSHWISVPTRWHRFRSAKTRHGSKTPELGRIQDGSPGVAILLCSTLCDHELLRCRRRRDPFHQASTDIRRWSDHAPSKRCHCIRFERVGCLLGKWHFTRSPWCAS